MNTTTSAYPAHALIAKYTPADYIDTYSETITCDKPLTVETFFDIAFNQMQDWVKWLLNIRNTLVKPLKLDTNIRFSQLVIEKNTEEIIVGKADRHLDFYVSIACTAPIENTQKIRITTAIHYNNILGKIYLLLIRPFHMLIVQSMLKRTVKSLQHQTPSTQ